MQDTRKTKSQLIEELRSLRACMAELQKQQIRVDSPSCPGGEATQGEAAASPWASGHEGSQTSPGTERENSLLRTLVHCLPEFMYIKDSTSRFVMANRSLCEHLGLRSPEEIVGKTDFDFFPRQEAEGYWEQERRVIRDGVPVSEERMVVGRDGPQWSLTTKMPIRDETTGQVIGLVGLNRNVTEWKRTEAALLQSESLLRHMVDSLPVVFYSAEAGTNKTLLIRGAVERLFGYEADDFFDAPDLGRRIEHHEDRDSIREAYQAGLASMRPFDLEFRVIHRSTGETRWIRQFVNPVADDEGRLLRQDCIIVDVTARRQAEEALRHSEELYRTLVETSPDSIMLLDLEGRISLANRVMAEVLGFDRPEELHGRRITDFIDPADVNRAEENLLRLIHGGAVRRVEYRAVSRHGQVIPVEADARLVRDTHGCPSAILGVTRDISDRKHAEEALRRSEERLRLALSAAEMGTWYWNAVTDEETRDASLNRILGLAELASTERIEDSIRRVHPNDVASVNSVCYGAIKDRQSYRVEFRVVRPDGSIRWLCNQGKPFYNQAGELTHVTGVSIDITAWKEAQLQSARLAQAVSHAGEGIAVWDQEWNLAYANDALAGILGCSSVEDLAGQDWAGLLCDCASTNEGGMERVLSTCETWRGRVAARRQDGRALSLAVTLSRLSLEDGGFLIVGNIRDMTREEEYIGQIRRLGRDADRLLEEERDRISKELHDELGQLLTAMNIGLAGLGSRASSGRTGLSSQVSELQDLVGRMLTSVRGLARSLRPGALEYRSLASALESLLDDFEGRGRVSHTLTINPPDMEVPAAMARVIYRIAQEALTNIARHSCATRCRVSLRASSRMIVLKVRDNGKVADRQALEGGASLGILGMKERAAAVGGSVQVCRMVDGGVCVTAQFPNSGRPEQRGQS